VALGFGLLEGLDGLLDKGLIGVWAGLGGLFSQQEDAAGVGDFRVWVVLAGDFCLA